ncbi:MAG: PaaI family thioesterase [Deltaproteobacteria bacterium]|nr:PaaI family thioesterase [Deltaproteobacteria bacterium]MBW1955264.1 PaaI family thioesterase [Deltaproteobacteria bacterium]MBW2130959.1 PaaI family thioesterase [Deltaproteobacteria bacterium]
MKKPLLNRIQKIPIVDTLQMQIIAFSDGYCEARVPRKQAYDGVFESFHGGLLMTLADSTACFAILTRTGAEARLTTTDMNIRFLAPCFTDVTAKATVIKFGRTLCPVSVTLFDAAQTPVAVAQVCYMLLDGVMVRKETK